ncbi:MAG TPA: PDZ domain-containing protein [Drouetiella sp.]
MPYKRLARKIVLVALISVSIGLSGNSGVWAEEPKPATTAAPTTSDTTGTNLQELMPQMDSTTPTQPSIDSAGENSSQNTPASGSNFHKLSVSKQASQLDTERMGADLAAPAQSDSFSLMNALFGNRGKELAKLYAERDTGYGVCGFIMSVPLVRRGFVTVMRCFPSMPAAQAQLQPGDLIIAVDGRDTRDMPSHEVWDYFTGMPGTEVNLEMRRGRQPFNVTLKRMDIGRIPDFATRARFLSLYQHNGMSKFVQR